MARTRGGKGRMPRPHKARPNWDELATIWTVSDELWAIIKPIVAELDPPKATDRPRISARAALDAVIFRLRSGCQWNQVPEGFPDDSSVHRTFQRWVRAGVFERIWAVLVERRPGFILRDVSAEKCGYDIESLGRRRGSCGSSR